MDHNKIQVNEIFGPTIQGEGAAAGRHCLFVRLANCNLRCSWCDTAYTWAWNEERASHLDPSIRQVFSEEENSKDMTADDVLIELQKLWDWTDRPTNIIFSGGEPIMQSGKEQLQWVVQRLHNNGNPVHVETAGTLIPHKKFDDFVTQYNVSPKLANSGNDKRLRFKLVALEWFARQPNAYFKYVCTSSQDLLEIDEHVHAIGVPARRVMVMPEGITLDRNLEVAREIADHATKLGFGLSLRTHIALWKDVRGK